MKIKNIAKWILLLPIYLISRLIGNFLVEYLLKAAYLASKNYYSLQNYQDFATSPWTMFATDFIVVYVALGFSLMLIQENKRKTGLLILFFTQMILFLVLMIGAYVSTGPSNFHLISLIFALVSNIVPFFAYYKKEIE